MCLRYTCMSETCGRNYKPCRSWSFLFRSNWLGSTLFVKGCNLPIMRNFKPYDICRSPGHHSMARNLPLLVTAILVLLEQLVTYGAKPTSTGPIWCPKGKFFNRSDFRCQKCKVSCQNGEVKVQYCSRFSDAVCIGITNLTDTNFRGFWSELNQRVYIN